MNTLGILIAYVGTPTEGTIRFKGRKDRASILKLDVVIISIKEGGDNNSNNSNNDEDCKKIKISKPNKYYGEWEKFKLWLLQFVI